MKTVYTIARAELQTLFYSPVAWLILIIFTFQVSMGFSTATESWVVYYSQGYKLGGISLDIFANQQYGIFMNVLGYMYLYIPLLTMGLMSREFASGSIKLLYSSPVTNAQIILGKYWSILLIILIVTLVVNFIWAQVILVLAFTVTGPVTGIVPPRLAPSNTSISVAPVEETRDEPVPFWAVFQLALVLILLLGAAEELPIQ